MYYPLIKQTFVYECDSCKHQEFLVVVQVLDNGEAWLSLLCANDACRTAHTEPNGSLPVLKQFDVTNQGVLEEISQIDLD